VPLEVFNTPFNSHQREERDFLVGIIYESVISGNRWTCSRKQNDIDWKVFLWWSAFVVLFHIYMYIRI